MQRTLVMMKPDAYQRKLLGTIISRIEQKGLKIAGMKLIRMTTEMAQEHYAPHKDKHFFDGLVAYIISGPVVTMVVEGTEAIAVMRRLVGATCGYEAQPGTIRGDFSLSLRYNLVHASDGEESAEREIAIFFRPEEIIDESLVLEKWTENE